MKKFFRRIVSFLGLLFTDLDKWIQEHVQPSIETVQRIKQLVESPVGNLLTVLIPGDWDDKLRDLLIKRLGEAIDAMHITAEIVNEPDWTSKVAKLLEYLKHQSKPMQQAIYKTLASQLAKLSGADGMEKVKGHSVDLLVQLQYSKMKSALEWDQLDEVDRFKKAKENTDAPSGDQNPVTGAAGAAVGHNEQE
jgi:hypothetical protein